MAEIHVMSEHETTSGWAFTIRIGRGTQDSLHTVTLSWADAEHWTRGTLPPSQLAEAIVRVALSELPPEQTPERFDAARLCRRIENFSEKLTRSLNGS